MLSIYSKRTVDRIGTQNLGWVEVKASVKRVSKYIILIRIQIMKNLMDSKYVFIRQRY